MNPRLSLAWALVIPINFFLSGFLGNFYAAPLEIVLLAFLFQMGVGLFLYHLLGRAGWLAKNRRGDFSLALILFSVLLVFVAAMFGMAGRFHRLFDAGYFLLEENQFAAFGIGSLIALPALSWTLGMVKQREIERTRLFKFLDENLPGLAAAAFFFSVYLILASIFNRPVFDVDDIFFDSDGLLWRLRFTTENWHDYYWRSVHPFVLLLIRPLVAFVSFFLKGDRLSAAFLLAAWVGALCVFLAWHFVKRTSGNSLYALLIASILGASAAHLVFGSLIETYIFLAAVQIFFFVLLLKPKVDSGAGRGQSLLAFVLVGLAAIGITLTNFAQTMIGFIVVKRDFKRWIKYGLLVALFTIPLTLLNNFIYPDANPYFFDLSSLNAEADNTFSPSVDRALAVVRVMAFHSIVAPDPLLLQEEIPFLKVWIFKADPLQLSEYETLPGLVAAFFWLALLVLGGLLFLKNLKKEDNAFPLAFILIVLFNLALHLRYGKDVFLYSANWTYAVVFFLALAWKELSAHRWFQVTLLVFLSLLLANNSGLIYTMLAASALHIK
ncbi:MAG: hypothetical protein HZB19_18270 [Chloroflexi bacterium]|nr:hypothetical protein [Chloroflexota bacterium]